MAAADVVAGALGGCWKSRDGEGDPPGMHDFDVILPDGRWIALEVTSAIDGQSSRSRMQLSDEKGDNSAGPLPVSRTIRS